MKRVFLAAVVVALVAVPAGVGGAKPDKYYPPSVEPFVIPAGEGCAFDYLVSPTAQRKIKDFSDGHTVTQTQPPRSR